MRTISAVLAGLLLATGAAAACGGGAAAQPAGSIKVVLADFSFNPSDLQAQSGERTFYLVNEGKSAHDMTVLGNDGKQLARSELVQPGNSGLLTVKLDAGKYQVICSQTGHADAGMKGSLTVS